MQRVLLALAILLVTVTSGGMAIAQGTGSPSSQTSVAATPSSVTPIPPPIGGPVTLTIPNPIKIQGTSTGSGSVASWIIAIATATGAIFAVWKWGVEEHVRRSREMATLDGDISVEVIDADSSIIGVVIESVWDNKGNLPVFLDRENCRVRIFELSLDAAPEVIDPTDEEINKHHKKVADFCPIRSSGMFMLEPGTSSRIQSSILLPKGPIYEVRSFIQTSQVGNRSSRLWWFRRRMFNSVQVQKS
jgi:hypothetical protein